ncbi:MAG TPA: VOC family protein [Mycobacteriales bacterium]|nr:VOC family protein [Mycobacteriales bacterium]
MQPLTGHHHVALSVSDLNASEEWYARVLGFVELLREAGSTRKAVVLRFANGATSVGLVQHEGEATDFDPTTTGLDHLAFSVATRADLDGWADHLTACGVPHSGPLEVPPGAILNFKDPDGITLALFWDKPR